MRRKLVPVIVTLVLVLPGAPMRAQDVAGSAPARTAWTIDTRHSELNFRIRHFVSRVNGTFTEWSGSILADRDDWTGGEVRVEITTASIDTRHERRDNHLRSSDFFLADSFPTITFVSRSVEATADGLRIEGDLTLRGVTRPVVLEGEYLGFQPGANDGPGRIGFSASTTIDRTDYGVQWNRAAEGGGMMLGDDVEIEITVAAVEKRD